MTCNVCRGSRWISLAWTPAPCFVCNMDGKAPMCPRCKGRQRVWMEGREWPCPECYPSYVEHETSGIECWCGPEVEQTCPECNGDEGRICWRCNGTGWVAPYDESLPYHVKHRDVEP